MKNLENLRKENDEKFLKILQTKTNILTTLKVHSKIFEQGLNYVKKSQETNCFTKIAYFNNKAKTLSEIYLEKEKNVMILKDLLKIKSNLLQPEEQEIIKEILNRSPEDSKRQLQIFLEKTIIEILYHNYIIKLKQEFKTNGAK